MKDQVTKLIDEYAGKRFRFLKSYLEGGYEDYVIENLDEIVYNRAFGRKKIRKEYSSIDNTQHLIEFVLEECKVTLEYVNKNLSNKV